MFLEKKRTGIWLVDVQENLFPQIHRAQEILNKLCFFLDATRMLGMPLFVTEQYPKGLGHTLSQIKEHFRPDQKVYTKTTFSGYRDVEIKRAADALEKECWILVGIETHICVLQTAKDLLKAKKEVIVLQDAVGSRSFLDFSSALEEMRAVGVRLSTTETLIYEGIGDAATPEFKELLPLVKAHA